MNNLIDKIKTVLDGIDKTELEDENGWWETSSGADFGKAKLKELIQVIVQHEEI